MKKLLILMSALILSACNSGGGGPDTPQATLVNDARTASVGQSDYVFQTNQEAGGYGGLNMTHDGVDLFSVVGFNYEAIFNSSDHYLSPRVVQQTLTRSGDTHRLRTETPAARVDTYITPGSGVVDFTIRITPYEHKPWLSFLFASYMNGPADKAFYFISNGSWESDTNKPHDYPFYYGVINGLMYLVMFDEDVIFARNDSGDGPANPAWDWYILLNNYSPGGQYAFSGRVIIAPFTGRADVVMAYEQWSGRIVPVP